MATSMEPDLDMEVAEDKEDEEEVSGHKIGIEYTIY